jgi:MoxR-like ATPase
MRIEMGYPGRASEIAILDTHGSGTPVAELREVATAADVEVMIAMAQAIHVAPSLKGYIVDLAEATRRRPELALGVSPRAALGLLRVARARAASQGREYVVPDDIKSIASPVLEHRLALSPEAQLRGVNRHDVLAEVLASVPVPTRSS